MGILVIDPQGEFSRELSGQRVGKQGLPLDEVLKSRGREVQVYRINQIQLDDWDTFAELLATLGFLEELNIPTRSRDNARKASERIRQGLQKMKIRLDALGTDEVFQRVLNIVSDQDNAKYIYKGSRADELVDYVTNMRSDSNRSERAFEKWKSLASLFAKGGGKKRLHDHAGTGIINELLQGSHGKCPVIAVDISREGNQSDDFFWSESLEKRILSKLLSILVYHSAGSLTTGKSANVLVVLDEAHRHAPSGRLSDDSESDVLRSLLRSAIRETRKYGLGWMFISQTLGGLDNEILQQLRILTFGFGLAMGNERDRLRDFVGGDKRALELYESFRDPQSFPRKDLQEFPFMAVGPISPLAFSGRPVFFTMFTDMEEFIAKNRSGKNG